MDKLVIDKKYQYYKQVLTALGITRGPLAQERDLMDSWRYEYDISLELVLEACRRTVSSRNPDFEALDRLLMAWARNGIHTVDALKAAEKLAAEKAAAAKKTSAAEWQYQKKTIALGACAMLVCKIPPFIDTLNPDRQWQRELEGHLNQLGVAGWELMGVTQLDRVENGLKFEGMFRHMSYQPPKSKWEHRYETIRLGQFANDNNLPPFIDTLHPARVWSEALARRLNEISVEGWELVGTVNLEHTNQGLKVDVFFKRPCA